MRVWRPGCRSRAAIAIPSRVTVAPVIGSTLATPRIPSVPNNLRPLLIETLVSRLGSGRRLRRRDLDRDHLDPLGRDSLTHAGRDALDRDLGLTGPRLGGG